MDAKKLLKKFGWCEGEGLGKNKDGLTKPLKVFMKRDNGGIGFKPGEEFSDDWWYRVFDKAAKSITIENRADSVTIKRRRNDSTFESLDEKDHAYDKPRLKYGGFLESSTVMVGTKMEKVINHTCTCSMSEEENVEMKRPSKKKKRLSDEELLAACGGRTTHRAARHGLKLSGKIQRLLDQEKNIPFVRDPAYHSNVTDDGIKSKKRKHDI